MNPKRALFSSFNSMSRRSFTSSTAKLPKIRCINKIPPMYKSRVVDEAQKALRDYLHTTRSFPFAFAEQIAANSPFSLANLLRKVHFSAPKFFATFQRLLRNKFFFSEDGTALAAACALSQFGFPWNRLGKLYEEEASIFTNSSALLANRLCLLKERYGIDNLCVVGVCLAYPCLLSSGGELGGEIDALLCDLKRVFVEFDEGLCVEGNVDAWYDLCCKVRIFHDLGCENVGELMCTNKEAFFWCPKKVLGQKAEYFCRFGCGKVDAGSLLLQCPDLLSLDLETPVISVMGFLEHVGLDAKELQCVREKYPHVFGRNKMAYLPHVIKALDLHERVFEKIRSSNGQLLATYTIGSPEEDIDKEFVDYLKKKQSSTWIRHTMDKVEFLNGIGFGECALTIKTLKLIHGNFSELQRRFDLLLSLGIKHSSLLSMIKNSPNILCISPEKVEEKATFLRREMGGSLEYLEDYPCFVCYDFENRIQRRYKFLAWLRDSGLFTKKLSFASMLHPNDKRFIARLFGIHPAAPKRYLEFFSYKTAHQ